MRRLVAWSMIGALSLAACSRPGPSSPSMAALTSEAGSPSPGASQAEATPSGYAREPLRLVTLGDAYTAGTDTLAPKRDSWPAQLAHAMDGGDVRLRLVGNLAESGQTSEDVIRTQLRQLEALMPDVVTLQVGVNDIIANDWSLDEYESNVASILDELLRTLSPDRVFVITTPDHTLTPWGSRWGPRDAGHAAVTKANAILGSVANERGITVIDIAAVNERVTQDASLVIGAGPYPTAKQYAGWVEIIGPQMQRVLAARAGG